MKVFYLPAGVLALILAWSLWAGRFLEMRTEHWTALLAGVSQAAEAEDWSGASRALRQAYEDWDRDQTFLHTILEHDALDEAEQLFAAAMAACRQEDGEEALIQIAQLTVCLEQIAETQGISIRNIF